MSERWADRHVHQGVWFVRESAHPADSAEALLRKAIDDWFRNGDLDSVSDFASTLRAALQASAPSPAAEPDLSEGWDPMAGKEL